MVSHHRLVIVAQSSATTRINVKKPQYCHKFSFFSSSWSKKSFLCFFSGLICYYLLFILLQASVVLKMCISNQHCVMQTSNVFAIWHNRDIVYILLWPNNIRIMRCCLTYKQLQDLQWCRVCRLLQWGAPLSQWQLSSRH